MRMRLLFAVAALAVVWGGVGPLAAQKKTAANPPHPANPPKPGNPNGRGPQESPAKQLERFQQMSPQDREKALAKLPPARRAKVEEQLQRLDSMPPAQREKLLKREEAFQNLP